MLPSSLSSRRPLPSSSCLLSMAGIDLDLKTGMSEEEMEAFAPLAKGLVLKVCRPGEAAPLGGVEAVTQSNAIVRTLAMAKADSSLYGRSEFESAQVRFSFLPR